MTGNLLLCEERVLNENATKKQITTSVIIPAYNEEEGLPIVLEKVFRSINGVHEVIVVDDGSDDATAEVAAKYPCRVVKHKVNRGKGAALKTGLHYAMGKNIIFIDADDTYPTDAIANITKELETHDLVYGTRIYGRENIPALNRFGNMLFQNMIRFIYGFKVSDYSTGLYGIKRDCFQQMDISSTGFAVEPEIAIKGSRMKLLMKEIPIEYSPRIGKTKLHCFGTGFDHLKTILGHVLWRPSNGH